MIIHWLQKIQVRTQSSNSWNLLENLIHFWINLWKPRLCHHAKEQIQGVVNLTSQTWLQTSWNTCELRCHILDIINIVDTVGGPTQIPLMGLEQASRICCVWSAYGDSCPFYREFPLAKQEPPCPAEKAQYSSSASSTCSWESGLTMTERDRKTTPLSSL